MKIAPIAPLVESVPPRLYGGTERIVSYLTLELVALGHDMTLFATGDSITAATLASCVPKSLRLDAGPATSMRNKENSRMTTINMPKSTSPKAVPSKDQGHPTERRFRLQVDRQTKASYSTLVDAEKAAASIKAAHPIVKVAIYDAEES